MNGTERSLASSCAKQSGALTTGRKDASVGKVDMLVVRALAGQWARHLRKAPYTEAPTWVSKSKPG